DPARPSCHRLPVHRGRAGPEPRTHRKRRAHPRRHCPLARQRGAPYSSRFRPHRL
ncbi:hypothetical protein AVDCRST_MAG82-612, partial [uncultured Rubrobacteraceae bacterium]